MFKMLGAEFGVAVQWRIFAPPNPQEIQPDSGEREMKGIQPTGQERCSDIQCVPGVSHSPGCQLYFIKGDCRSVGSYKTSDTDGERAREGGT